MNSKFWEMYVISALEKKWREGGGSLNLWVGKKSSSLRKHTENYS